MPTSLADPAAVRLVGDVGGTHARFALVTGPDGLPHSALTLRTADFPDMAAAVEHYLRQAGGAVACEAAVAIANPIDGDAVRMTNGTWAFSIEATRRRLRLERLLLLNDWEAMALAAPAFDPADLLKVGGGEPVDAAPRGLIGPGTGLGVALLVRAPGGPWIAIAGEGGHASLAATSPREADVIGLLWHQYPHVSAERLVSGMGLENLYQAIARLDGVALQPLGAADISRLALARQDAQCEEALALFCGLLGNVAGNLALTLGARGGIYVGGGIVRRLGDYFTTSPFRRKFEAKGRFADYLARIPSYVILADHPALTGAAVALGVRPAARG